MAESKQTPEPEAQVTDIAVTRPLGESFLPSDDTERLVREAPDTSSGAKKVYRVLYPLDRFVVPGLPVVTREGVALTGEQEKVLLAAIEADSGVKVVSD